MKKIIKIWFTVFFALVLNLHSETGQNQKETVFLKEIIIDNDSVLAGRQTKIKNFFIDELKDKFDFTDSESDKAGNARYFFVIRSTGENLSGEFIDNKTGIMVNSETVRLSENNIAESIKELAVLLCRDKSGLKFERNPVRPAQSDQENKPDSESEKKAVEVYNNANRYFGKLELETAIEYYTRAIQINPRLYHAYNNRANVYLYQGNYEKAVEDYSKAIEIVPKFDTAYVNRANAYQKLGFYDCALKDLNCAIEINPFYLDAYYNKALMFEKLKRPHEAAQAYKQYIRYAPPDDRYLRFIRNRVKILDFVK